MVESVVALALRLSLVTLSAISLLLLGVAPAAAERPSVRAPAAAKKPAPAVHAAAPAAVPVRKRDAATPARPTIERGERDDGALAKAPRSRPIRIALTSGYGADLDRSLTGVNPFGVSFGIRGGYCIGPAHIGTRFLFFLGQTRTLADGYEQSADEWLLGFEGGWGFRAGPFVARPELGFGLAISSSESARPTDMAMEVPVDTSSEDPYLELGVAFELDLSRRLFIGVDPRLTLVLGKKASRSNGELFALLALGTLGMRF